ncbi:MAG TPA: hypothetical protein VI300_09330, partial [Solirubrobacter sp.]
MLALDHRAHVALDAQPQQPLELVAGAHRGAHHRELEEEHAVQARGRVGAGRRARDDERPAGLERLQRVIPRRRAHRLGDHVDALGEPRARLEDRVG